MEFKKEVRVVDVIALDSDLIEHGDPMSYCYHIEYSNHPLNNEKNMVVSICGFRAHEDNILWYDDESLIDCPICLDIVNIAKMVKLNQKQKNSSH